MSEKLMNTKDVCQYLGILEKDLRKLVEKGEIPAYRLGGTILRFRKAQIDALKTKGLPKLSKTDEDYLGFSEYSPLEKLRDFLYFNDFYLIAAIVIAILLIVIFFY